MKRRTTDKKRQTRTPSRLRRRSSRPNVTAGGRRILVLASLTTGATRATAAKAAGITTRTLDRYTTDPAFRIELESARRSAFEDALGGIRGAAGSAVESLAALLRSKREGTRLRAASEIITFAMRAHDTGEIEARVAALEKKAAEISHREGAVN